MCFKSRDEGSGGQQLGPRSRRSLQVRKAALALKLARLPAACGQWDRVVKELDPHRDIRTANRCELLQDLGYALCKLHGSQPQSAEYQRGLQLLQESQEMCVQPGCAFVPHLRKQESLHARALSRLGWALQRVAGREYEGREYLRKAGEHEPRNPYYLADMLGAEIRFMRQAGLPDAMRSVIREAIKTCREHAVAGIELPNAFFGGGPISMLEYHLGLAFGASVAVITGTGGAVESLLKDELWRRLPNLLPLPCDAASVRAVVAPPEYHFPSTVLEQMAVAFHENYVAQSTSRLPDNMKPWPKLAATYQKANLEQARYAVQILAACGFDVRAVSSPAIFQDFSDLEIDKMAEMEHGRWNVERLRNGWRYGPRDDKQQLHNCLVPWTELLKNPDNVARYDREAVRKFPEILAKAGLEVYRR